MAPVLECSTKLSSVQGELEIDFTVDGFCFGIIFNPTKTVLLLLQDKAGNIFLG